MVEAAFGPPGHWTVAQARQGWRAAADGEFWSRCLVVLVDDDPVAVAAAFHPRLHASAEWASVEVPPLRRRQGWGRHALAEILRTLPPDAGPLRAKVADDSPAAGMAEHVGMRPVQRTRQVRVHVPTDLPGLLASTYSCDDPVAIDAWRHWYITGHSWDPPQPQPDGFWADMAAGAQHVIGVPGAHGLEGIGHVYIDEDTSWFVGGALDPTSPAATSIAAGLLSCARRLVGDPLHVELDDWMADVVSVVDGLDHIVLDEALIVMGHPQGDAIERSAGVAGCQGMDATARAQQ